MKFKAMLTIDLKSEVTPDQQKIFEQALEEKKMKKIEKLPSTWVASFKDDLTKKRAILLAKNIVKTAIKKASISKYAAAVQFGESFPEVF